MRTLTVSNAATVNGGSLSGVTGALSGITAGAAVLTAEAGAEAAVVPVVGTAVGGCLEVGAAVLGIVAGVEYLLDY